MTRNSLRKLRTGVLVSLAGAAVLSTAQVAKAEEATTPSTEPAVTTTSETPTEVVEAQISALETEIATLEPAVATPVGDNGVYTAEATATETVSTVEADLATAEATLATATTELETLQATPETAIPNGEQPYVTAVDEAQKAYDAKVAELETATETHTVTINGDEQAHNALLEGRANITRLEPVYDGERTVTLPLDENFQVDPKVVGDLIVENVQNVRTANGLTGNGVRTADADKIAEFRLNEIKSRGVLSHDTSLPKGVRDSGVVSHADNVPYIFMNEVIGRVTGKIHSNEELAHDAVQSWLTDIDNVMGNNIGHSEAVLAYRHAEYGVATDGEFVVMVFANPDYGVGRERKDGLSTVPVTRAREGAVGWTDLTRDEVIGKVDVNKTDSSRFRKTGDVILETTFGSKAEAEEALRGYPESIRSTLVNNYVGSPTQTSYIRTYGTDELKVVKYLPKTTFVYTQERPLSQSDKDAELYNYIVALNKAKTDLTNYRLMNPTRPNAVSNANAIREAEARVASAQGKVNDLKAQLTSAKTALGTAKSNVTDYEARLDEYNAKSTRLAQARRELEALKARLASTTNGVSTPVVESKPVATKPVVETKPVVTEAVNPVVETKPVMVTEVKPVVETKPATVAQPSTTKVTEVATTSPVNTPVVEEVKPVVKEEAKPVTATKPAPAVVTESISVPVVTKPVVSKPDPVVVTDPISVPVVTTPDLVIETVKPSETVTAPAPADKTAPTKPETTETEAGKALANGGAAGDQATVELTEEAQASSPVAPTKVDLATPLTAPAPAVTPVETKQVSEPEGGATALAASNPVATPTYSRVAARQALPATGSRTSYASLLAGLSSLSLAGLVWKRERG